MNKELIEACERLGRQIAYGQAIDLVIAEKSKYEFGSEGFTALQELLNQIGKLSKNN